MQRQMLAAIGLVTCATGAIAQPRYTLELLADLPGGIVSSQGMALNAAGLVAGQSVAADGYYATQWAAPDRTPLSLGDVPGGNVSSMVYGINDAGTSVGTASGASGSRGFRLSSGGTMQDLGDLPGGVNASGALAVNNAGVAVGYSYSAASGNNPVAVIWTPGVPALELGDLPGGALNSEAHAINDAGAVAGVGTTATGKSAFLWTAGTGMVALPNLPGGTWGMANGINEAGWVVGYSLTTAPGSAVYHAALWHDGLAIDLGSGSSQSYAYDVNNLGQAVGSHDGRAVLWTADQQRLDLGALVDDLPAAWVLSNAMAVNDAGQITGWGVNGAGNRVGFLLSPVTAVPEPGIWTLWLAGLAASAPRLRRRALRRP